MIKHWVVWTLKAPEERAARTVAIRERAEDLIGKIDGLHAIMVVEGMPLDASSGDVALYAEFDDLQALADYQVHPLHVAMADEVVKPYVATRRALDWQVK